MYCQQNRNIISVRAGSDLAALAFPPLPIQMSPHLQMSASDIPWTSEQFCRLVVQDVSGNRGKHGLLNFQFLAGLHCLYLQGTF